MATVIGMAGAKNFSKILKLPLAQSGAAMYYIQPALEEGASENGGNVGITKRSSVLILSLRITAENKFSKILKKVVDKPSGTE